MRNHILSILASFTIISIAALPASAQEGTIERVDNRPFYASLDGEVTIDAPAHIVWEALMAVDNYAEWNPAILDVQPTGSDLAAVGERFSIRLPRWWGHKDQWVKVQVARAPNGEEPGEWVYNHDDFASRINWLGVQRIHHVEQVGEGQTLFQITEVYTGATWTAAVNYTKGVLETFLERLKQRAETLVK